MASIESTKEFLKTAPRYNPSVSRRQTDEQIMIRALTELDQKNTLNNATIISAKKSCAGICPNCKKAVSQLTAAHIGKTRAVIIRGIIKTYYPGAGLPELLEHVNEANKNVDLVIVCRECNYLVEKATCM
jgi:ribosomal protein L44E